MDTAFQTRIPPVLALPSADAQGTAAAVITTPLTHEDFLLAGTSETLTELAQTDMRYAARFGLTQPLVQQCNELRAQQNILVQHSWGQVARQIIADYEFSNGVVSGIVTCTFGGFMGGVVSFMGSSILEGATGSVIGGALSSMSGGGIGSVLGGLVGGAIGITIGTRVGNLGASVGGAIAGIGTAISVAYGIQDSSWQMGVGGTLASLALCFGVSFFGSTYNVIISEISEHLMHNKSLSAQKLALAQQLQTLETQMTAKSVQNEFAKDPELYIYYLQQKVLPNLRARITQANGALVNLNEFLKHYEAHLATIDKDFPNDTERRVLMRKAYATRKAEAEREQQKLKKAQAYLDALEKFCLAQSMAIETIIESRAAREEIEKRHARVLGKSLSDLELAENVNESIRHEVTTLILEASEIWEKIYLHKVTADEVKQLTREFDFKELVKSERASGDSNHVGQSATSTCTAS